MHVKHLPFDQNPNGVRHKLRRHFQDLVWQCGRNEANLRCRRQIPINVIDLFLESLVQHFVGFVQHQHFDGPGSQYPTFDHIKHPPGRSTDHMLPIIQLPDVLTQVCSTDTSVTLYVHEIAQRQNNLLDLDGQFARWRQAEDLSFAQRRVHRLQNGD